MVLYECYICNFSSKIKTHYNRHLKTKKHTNKIKNTIINKESENDIPKKTPKDPKKTQKDPKRPNKESINLCIYCNAEFSSYAHKRRHEIHRCNKTGVYKTNQEMNELKKEKMMMMKQINKLIDKAGNTYNTQNNIQNNIKINGYGEENLNYITDNFKTQLLKGPYGMIPKMIEAVHFNDDIPENKNISLPNKKENKLKIFKKNKWIYKNKNDVINDLVDGKYFILDNHYENLCNEPQLSKNIQISDDFKQIYNKFRKLFDDKDKELHDQMFKECELILLNNR